MDLECLVGYEVIQIIEFEAKNDNGLPQGLYEGLMLKKGLDVLVAWIMVDNEGNGPGFLDILSASRPS